MSAKANELPAVIGSEEAVTLSDTTDHPLEAAEPAKGTGKLGLPNELNNRINRIDDELTELRNELAQANKSVKSGLNRLDKRHVDLGTQVSDAYKHLGALDGAYRELTDRSSRITGEIQSVAATLDELKTSTAGELNDLSAEYQALAARVEELAGKSRLAVQALNRGIRENGKALREMREQLQRDIDALSRSSREQGETLGAELNQTKGGLARALEQINTTQARLLKMQDVDQALERRASALEETAAQLREQTGELATSTKALQQLGGELVTAVEELRARAEAQAREIEAQGATLGLHGEQIASQTARLDLHEGQLDIHAEQLEVHATLLGSHSRELEDHTGRIGELDQAHTETRASLLNLARIEQNHFRGLGLAAVVLLLISAWIYHQNTQDQAQQAVDLALTANRAETQDRAAATAITRLDQRANALETSVAVARQTAEQGDQAIRREVAQENQALRQEVAQESQTLRKELDTLNDRLVTLNDQVDSVGGRVANLRPGSAGQGAKTIHGPQWLAERPAGDYVVWLAVLNDKQALYRLAERYGRHLSGELAYLPFNSGTASYFALVQSGYASQAEAQAAKSALPRSLEGQQPEVYSLASIRPYLGK